MTLARAALAACLALATTSPASAADDAHVRAIDIRARPISTFLIGSDQTRFGPFEFAGGLEMTSADWDLGALSAIHVFGDTDEFMGVADTGLWYAGRIERSDDGRPAAISGFRMADILDADGKARPEKWMADAESMAIDGDRILVGFERTHRISAFPLDREEFAGRPTELPLPVPPRELRANRGFETLAVAPAGTPLDGGIAAITERSLDKRKNIMAAVIGGPRDGQFSVRRIGDFDVTDGDFLPDGDLLLLERRYAMASGVAMRIRRIAAADIVPGTTVDGPILLEADMRYQIDNMEGLSVSTNADGETIVTIVSDDNHSILQRNLLLQFVYRP